MGGGAVNFLLTSPLICYWRLIKTFPYQGYGHIPSIPALLEPSMHTDVVVAILGSHHVADAGDGGLAADQGGAASVVESVQGHHAVVQLLRLDEG